MNINRPFILVLAALPFVEIALMVSVIGHIGFVPTLGILLISASIGMAVIRHQGMSALIRSQQAMARGELPAKDIVTSGIAVLGGVLLVIPGILSDVLAIPCLIPNLRSQLADRLIASRFMMPAGPGRPSTSDSVIEGEFRRED